MRTPWIDGHCAWAWYNSSTRPNPLPERKSGGDRSTGGAFLSLYSPIAHIGYGEAIVLGLLQGVTEFLPVSSTAHMDIFPQLFFKKDPGAIFSAVVQLGPIIAIIAYFWKDLVKYFKGIMRTNPFKIPPGDTEAKLGWFTALGTIPICIFGLALQHTIENEFRSLYYVSASLIVLALVLWWAERTATQKVRLENLTLRQTQVIGWAQVLALLPGTSRSGVTITAGLFQGLDRESAARFSFLLSIPAITLAGLHELDKLLDTQGLGGETGPYLLGLVVAGLFAFVVIWWFLGYMKEHNTGIFIAYRIVLGVAVLLLLHFHVIKDTHNPLANPTRSQASVSARVAATDPTFPHTLKHAANN